MAEQKRMGFTHESTYNESKEWYTPPGIFKALGLQFDLDPASPGADAVPWIPAAKHLTILDDGLRSPWAGSVWLNPPYGMDTPAWTAKFARHITSGGSGIMLVFSRTDTRWFHEYAPKMGGLLFIRGRIQFISADGKNGKGGAGAGSLLMAGGADCVAALKHSGLGLFIDMAERGQA